MDKKITPIVRRLVSSSAAMGVTPPEEITYQHTVLCQTCLPYRDPGDGVQRWEKSRARCICW